MVTSRIPLDLIQSVVSATRKNADQTELLYVTNLIEGDIAEYDSGRTKRHMQQVISYFHNVLVK